jgi:hypothetical protein
MHSGVYSSIQTAENEKEKKKRRKQNTEKEKEQHNSSCLLRPPAHAWYLYLIKGIGRPKMLYQSILAAIISQKNVSAEEFEKKKRKRAKK